MSEELLEEEQTQRNKMKQRSATEKKMKTDREERKQEIAEEYGFGSYEEFYVQYRDLPTELQDRIEQPVSERREVDIRTMVSDLSAAAWVDHIN